MSTESAESRYVTDVPYARRFVRELAPAWLDFTALICGFRPPARENGFAWCELGCGHGVTPALLAVTHQNGQFLGIDLMPQHADFGKALCRDAGIGNARFEALDFAAAAALDLPPFDYIVAHGVYTWIDAAAQADLIDFVDRHLKPGGLVYLSYDCQPGWAADMPLQHLLRDLAERAAGDSIARLDAADRTVTALMNAGAAVLRQGAMGREWEELRRRLPPSYFVHQFLPPGWQPLYVTEVRHAAAGIDLVPIGSATIRENVDAFTLDRAERELVNAASDPDMRELLRDYLLMKRFRRDVFGRITPPLAEPDQRQRIVETHFMLPPTVDATSSNQSPVPFNDPAAQRILGLLSSGPASPSSLLAEGEAIGSLVAQIIALAAAGRIWPVDAPGSHNSVDRANAAIQKRMGGPDEIAFLALPVGTAIELNEDQLQRLGKDGETAATREDS